MVRPERLELPAFWFVANGVNMLNVLFGVAYGLETPFSPQLAAPNLAPKTELYRVRKLMRDLSQLMPSGAFLDRAFPRRHTPKREPLAYFMRCLNGSGVGQVSERTVVEHNLS